MNRRNFMTTAAASGLAAPPPPAASHPAIFELRSVRTRNGSQTQRTTDFYSKYYAPALKRLEIGPSGFFGAVIAEHAPFLLSLISYPSMGAMETAMDKMAGDSRVPARFR